MDISYLIEQLKLAELPGLVAHKEMSFTNRNFDKPLKAIHSAVGILLFENNHQLYFPLIKRTGHLQHHKGQMALPGGRLEDNESIFECVKRETEEEIFVPKENIQIVRQLTELYIPVSNHLVFPVICYSKEPPVFSAFSDEVEKVVVCNIHDLLSLKKQTAKVNIKDNMMIEAPAFIYKDEIIWGATALILNEFKVLVSNIMNIAVQK